MRPERSPDVIWREFNSKILVFDPETGALSKMNLTGSRVWGLCDGTRTVDEICEVIEDEFSGCEAGEVKRPVSAFIEELDSRKLLK